MKLKRNLVLVFVLLALQFSLSAQVQPNTELIGKWPYGFIDYMVGHENFVLVSNGRSLQIYDYSIPIQPVLVSEVWLNDKAWRMQIVEETVYVACSNGVFAAVDIGDPAQPELLMEVDLNAFLLDFVIQEQYAYVVVQDQGIYVFDLSEPSNPLEVARLFENQRLQALKIRNNTAYIGGVHKVMTYAMPDPLTMEQISSFARTDFVKDIVLDENKLYGLSEHTGMFVLDISDPANMSLLSVSESIRYAAKIIMEGDLIAITSAWDGMLLYDKTVAKQPVKIYEFDPGDYNRAAIFMDNYIHFNGANTLHTFDISDLDNIQLIYAWSAPGEARTIEFYNNHLYATGVHNTLSVLDMHDPESPQLMYLNPEYEWYRSLCAHDDKLFVGDTRGLLYYDISNPSEPQLMDTLLHVGGVEMMEINGQFLFAYRHAVYDTDFFILDIADINNPILINEMDIGSFDDMQIDGDKLYVFNSISFKIFDISDLTNPVLIYTSSDYYSHSRNLAYRDGYVYLLEGSGSPWTRIRVMDVSDPYNVRPLTTLEIVAELEKMIIVDNWLYVSKKTGGIQIYDLTIPAQPEWCGYFDASGMIWDFGVNENDFYVSVRNSILFGRFDQLMGQEPHYFIPATERLHVYPNPAAEQLSFELPQADKAYTYQIFDLAGKMLEKGQLKSGSQQLDLQNLSQGMYLIEVGISETSGKKALFMKK